MDSFSPQKHFLAAKKLLGTEDQAGLKYVALELRFCLEAITYKKLTFYKKLLPPSLDLKQNWNPRKLLPALIRLEPSAGQSFSILIGKETIPGVAVKPDTLLGCQNMFEMKWLEKAYNKLGKLLHLNTDSLDFDIRKYLEEVLAILEPVVNSSLEGTLTQRIALPCGECGENVPINMESVMGDYMELECLNPKCGCVNVLQEHKETKELKLFPNKFELTCSCGQKIHHKKGLLKIGSEFRCPHCHQIYQVTQFKADAPIQRDARFSQDKQYRYSLVRSWGKNRNNFVNFILLNPSTADEYKDDPTISKCIWYAKQWGFDGMYVTNLFALRSTNPKGLYKSTNPVGAENNAELQNTAARAKTIVCAWGNFGEFMHRGQEVIDLLEKSHPLHCLEMTKKGHPHHPLYCPSRLEPVLLKQVV